MLGGALLGCATVLQLTDLHLLADKSAVNKGVNPFTSFRAVAVAAKQRFPHADALLLTGDLSQDDTVESYRNLRSIVEEVWGSTGAGEHAPAVLFIPGNHENLDNLAEVLLEAPALVGPVTPDAHVLVAVKGWRLLLLCSHIPPGSVVHGALPEGTLTAAAAEVGTLQAGTPVLAAVHHPPVPPAGDNFWSESCLATPGRLLDTLAALPAVKLLVHGHLHAEHMAEGPTGMPLLGAPSTCHQYRLASKDPEVDTSVQPGFRVLHLHADGSFDTEVVRVTPVTP
mmetsp:Transcript_19295/g.49556  ORF Transcript_19295/g.49556 Transcript_19295/m.49556 type:complete len:283 (-) Transcript_19295:314-1162(-)|eukprot:jgi/Tetstr1/434065/TSEL_023209.t1